MNIKDVAKLSPTERFLYWIKERECIRLKKESGKPKPWTDDEILQKYRFCNIRRMDDKVSQWLLKNWYEPFKDHKNMLLACALARFVNSPRSLEAVGFPTRWNPSRIKKILRSVPRPIFNGAYMIRCNDGIDKVECVVDYDVHPLSKLDIVVSSRMEETWKNLLPCFGFGSFMAGQIVADLRWGVTGEWRDKLIWAPKGPGSRRGINRLLGRDKKIDIRQSDFERHLSDIISMCIKKLPHVITGRLEAIDYQNCCCEFDKYERTLFEGRRSKSRYQGV